MDSIFKHKQWESCHFDTFDILRFPMAVLVIYIHCRMGIPDGYYFFDSIMDFTNFGIILRIYISIIISSVCVPTFFLISGYLFYNNQTSFCWMLFCKKLKRRLFSLVIPYFLWILLLLFIIFLLMIPETNSFQDWRDSIVSYIIEHGNIHIFYDTIIIKGEPYNLPVGWEQDNSAPLLFTFWYIRDLILTILISPIIYGTIKLFKSYFIMLLAVSYILNLWPYIHGFSIVSIFYFTLGIYLSSHPNIMNLIIKRYKWPIILSGSILSIICLYLFSINSQYYNYMIHIFIILGVFITLYIGWTVVNKGVRPINLLKNSAFFIYAAHTIYINRFCTLFVLKILPWNNPLCDLLQYLSIPIIIAFVCLCIFYISQKLFPHFLSLFIGGRTS